MQIQLNQVKKLCGINDWEAISTLPSLRPFDSNICNFLSTLSEELLHDKVCRNYPDIITFAFFCRKKNIEGMKQSYESQVHNRIGRGVSFHIAPSNVPINFAYSLISGLLAGSICVVKVSNKRFPQTELIVNAMKCAALKLEIPEILNYATIILYEREQIEITKQLSELCDVRVLWGGDETIRNIRQCPLASRAFDITFADRYSLLVIDAKEVIATEKIDEISEKFYNDTYLYDQNACTAPHLLYWLGTEDEVERAKVKFWKSVTTLVRKKYELPTVVSVNKYMNLCRTAIGLDRIQIETSEDNFVKRISLKTLEKEIVDYRCAGGSFLEYESESLQELMPIINNKYQTITYIGSLKNVILENVMDSGVRGIDRIVPVGKSMDFELIWDGSDLIVGMSRVVVGH